MSLRDKYTDEEWDELEKNSSQRDFSPGWTERKSEYQKVYIVSDEDGHEYVIPYLLKDVFRIELEKSEKYGSSNFETIFEKFRCGGDPFGEYEFYIKK